MWKIPQNSTTKISCRICYIILIISKLCNNNKIGMICAMILRQSFKPMKSKYLFMTLSVLMFASVACDVERSEKYQSLLAERDSLYT